MPLMWLKCLILILKMAWAKLISFLNGLISKISQNKPVKPVKFFSSFPDESASGPRSPSRRPKHAWIALTMNSKLDGFKLSEYERMSAML
ncbi:hypothetical protein V8E52_000186 [Russula decolorans]